MSAILNSFGALGQQQHWLASAMERRRPSLQVETVAMHPDNLPHFEAIDVPKNRRQGPAYKAAVRERADALRGIFKQQFGTMPFRDADVLDFAATPVAYAFSNAVMDEKADGLWTCYTVRRPATHALVFMDPESVGIEEDLSTGANLPKHSVAAPLGVNFQLSTLDHELFHLTMRAKAGHSFLWRDDERGADRHSIAQAKREGDKQRADYFSTWRVLQIFGSKINPHHDINYYHPLSLRQDAHDLTPDCEAAAVVELKEICWHLANGRSYTPPKFRSASEYLADRLHGQGSGPLRLTYATITPAQTLRLLAQVCEVAKIPTLLPETKEAAQVALKAVRCGVKPEELAAVREAGPKQHTRHLRF